MRRDMETMNSDSFLFSSLRLVAGINFGGGLAARTPNLDKAHATFSHKKSPSTNVPNCHERTILSVQNPTLPVGPPYCSRRQTPVQTDRQRQETRYECLGTAPKCTPVGLELCKRAMVTKIRAPDDLPATYFSSSPWKFPAGFQKSASQRRRLESARRSVGTWFEIKQRGEEKR